MTSRLVAAVALVMTACPTATGTKGPDAGESCNQDGTCAGGLTCFPDFRCYPSDADPGCTPPCWGEEPFCDKTTLRCVACLSDTDCEAGHLCVPPLKRCEPGCSAARPLCGAGETCDVTLQICRGCFSDTDCTTPDAPRCDALGQCVHCVEDRDDCPAGQYCSVSGTAPACAPGCKASSECDAGMDCCAHRCVDVATDSANCGLCDNPCRGNTTCCTGLCVNLTSDVDNCSACGRSCQLPNVVGPMCASATCSDRGCEPYFGDCDGDHSNGCEANLSFNAQHCGSCGRACQASGAHTVGECNLGGCAVGCQSGWGNCNLLWTDGCEEDFSQSAAHCGRCNNPCTSPATCVNGQCT
jgi:hypothetical protein